MGAWAELDPFATGWIRVGEIQGLLKKLPPPLNAEYLPIPVAAIQLRASTDYESGVTSTVEITRTLTITITLSLSLSLTLALTRSRWSPSRR